MGLTLAVPDGEGEVPHVLLAGPGQEAAVDSPGLEQRLRLQACDVSVEPPGNTHTHTHITHLDLQHFSNHLGARRSHALTLDASQATWSHKYTRLIICSLNRII